VLVPAFGVVGASIALLGASSLRVLFTVLAYRSALRLAAPRLLIRAEDLFELARYRGALMASVARVRPAGDVE
jgi:hypothetical protein